MNAQQLLSGRGAVVSGGSRGIGRAVAELLCGLGAGVVVNGRAEGAVDETVAAIGAAGGRATAVVGAANDQRIAGDSSAASTGRHRGCSGTAIIITVDRGRSTSCTR